MDAFTNIEVLQPESRERLRLRIRFQRLMNGLLTNVDDKRPPHPSTFDREQYLEVAAKAASIIHEAAPQLEEAIARLAEKKSKPGLLIRDLPFEYDIPKPGLFKDSKLAELRNIEGCSTLNAQAYYQDERKGTFSDFFTMGVQSIISAHGPVEVDKPIHGTIRNSLIRTIQQGYHRDNQMMESQAPHYTTFSCHTGNSGADTHILGIRAAIDMLSPEQKEILNEKRFRRTKRAPAESILYSGPGHFLLNPKIMNIDQLLKWPGKYKGQDPQAQEALDTFVNALELNKGSINLKTGDFMILDQDHLLHGGSVQLPFLSRHVSNVTFGRTRGWANQGRW